MKKYFKKFPFYISIALIVASLFLTPAAFCLWLFDDDVSLNDAKSNIGYVDDYVTFGTFTLTSYPSLIVLEEGDTGSSSLKNGIMFYRSDDSYLYILDNTLSCVYQKGESEEDFSGDILLGVQVTLSDTIKPYITVIDDYSDGFLPFNEDGTLTFDSDGKVNLELELNEYFRYTSLDVKPNSKEKYNELNNLINSSIALTFTLCAQARV